MGVRVLYTATALGGPAGGGGGKGIVGGGAGGGKPITGILRLGVNVFGGASCCPKPRRADVLGLWRSVVDPAAMEARFPGTKEGVLETARAGREEERKGAGSERICTEVGRRSDCPGGAAVWKEWRAFVCRGCTTELEVAAPEEGRAGSVTERDTTTPSGRRAGLLAGASDPRRWTTTEPSESAPCGLTGNGRKNGFGVADMRRPAAGLGKDAAVVVKPPIAVDAGRVAGGVGSGVCGGGDITLVILGGGALELRKAYRAGAVLRGWRATLARTLLEGVLLGIATGCVTVKDVNEDDEIGVPDSNLDCNLLGSLVVGEVGP